MSGHEWMCGVCGNVNGRDISAAPLNCMRCGQSRGARAYPAYCPSCGKTVHDRCGHKGLTVADAPLSPEQSIASVRGILAGFIPVGPESDAARMDWLEAQGVVSIYLSDGRQINAASMSVRAAIDAAKDSLAGAPVPAVDPSRSTPDETSASTPTPKG